MEALSWVEMEDFAKTQMGKLSGGQQQRVFIARALVNEPELLIMDEPTLGVDTRAMNSINDILLRLKEKMQLTIIVVTHDIGVISVSADSLACVNKRLYFHARPEALDKATLDKTFACEVEMLFHGELPHRVVEKHS
jgi:zinc transport system ATP-binding protein